MSEYTAPLRDMQFVLRELTPLEQVAALPGCEEISLDLADAILEEAGKFASGVPSPINASGDREGARRHDSAVFTASGWQMARAALVSLQRLRESAGDPTFHRAKLETARFYADHVLARAPGLARTVVHGAAAALAIEDDQF